MTDNRFFPWLSDALQDVAHHARSLGLAISHFNSGARRDNNNGTRIFTSADCSDGYVGFFRGDHRAGVDQPNSFYHPCTIHRNGGGHRRYGGDELAGL